MITQTVPPSMAVLVGADQYGALQIDNVFRLSIKPPDWVHSRIDSIIMRREPKGEYPMEVLEGWACVDPVATVLPVGATRIAYVYVQPGISVITNHMITNLKGAWSAKRDRSRDRDGDSQP